MSDEYAAPEEIREQEVAEFAEKLAADPEELAADPEEQAEIPAEDDESPADESGPTAEMIAVAKLSGVPEALARSAKDNAGLQQLIDYVSSIAANESPPAQETPVDAEVDLKFEIGEDDFDESDPVHRQLRSTVDVLNKKLAETKRTLSLLVQHANAQLQERQNQEAMTIQQPFDEALDELNAAAFGTTNKGLTDAQVQMRSQAFRAYMTLVEGEPPERRKQLAQAAVRAKFEKLMPKQPIAPQVAKAMQRQARQRMGTSAGKQSPEKLDHLDAFAKALASMSTQ